MVALVVFPASRIVRDKLEKRGKWIWRGIRFGLQTSGALLLPLARSSDRRKRLKLKPYLMVQRFEQRELLRPPSRPSRLPVQSLPGFQQQSPCLVLDAFPLALVSFIASS